MPSQSELIDMIPVSLTAPSLNSAAAMHAKGQLAAARAHAYGQEAAAGAQALGHLRAAEETAGAHERSLAEAARIHEAGATQRAGMQNETSLAQAATARYAAEAGHAGANEYNLAQAAKLRGEEAGKVAGKAAAVYQSGAFGLLGIPEATRDSKGNITKSRMEFLREDPKKLELFETHKGNLPNLQQAYDSHQWWEKHGSPENIGGFLDFAKSKGTTFTPERESLFRAKAGARDPEIRRHFGPHIEEYVKSQPTPTFTLGGQGFSLSEAARRVGEGGYYQ